MSDTDLRRAEFRRFLQRSGVSDAITKALVSLYEESEKPPNAVEYIAQFIGCSGEGRIANLLKQINELKKENEELKMRLEAKNKMDD